MVNLTYFTPMVLAGVGQFGTAPLDVGSQYIPVITEHRLIDNHKSATSPVGASNGDNLYANLLDYDGFENYVTHPTSVWGANTFKSSDGSTATTTVFPDDVNESGGTFATRISYGALVIDAEECATRCMAHDLCMGFQYSDPTAPGANNFYPDTCGLLMRISLTSNVDSNRAEANVYLRNTFPNGWEPTRMQVGYECDGTAHDTLRDPTAPMTVEKCKDFCFTSITERAVITGTDECHCFNKTECSSPIEFDGSGTPNTAQRTRAGTRWYDYDMVLDYTPAPTVSPTVSPTGNPTVFPTASPTVYTTYSYDQMSSGGSLAGANPHVRTCYDPLVSRINDNSLVTDISFSDIYYLYGLDSNGQYNYITQAELGGQTQFTESLWSDDGSQPDPRDLSFSAGVGQAACEEECNKADKCIGYTVHRSNADCRLLTHCKGRGKGAQTNTDVYARKSFRYGWEAEEVASGATCDGGNLFFGPSDLGTGEPVTPEQCFNHCQGLFGITYISIDDLRCSCWRTCPAYLNDDRFVTYKVKAADVIAPQPTTAPTKNPTKTPTKTPTKAPSKSPTNSPTTPIPTKSPTTPAPTDSPTTPDPTTNPTKAPSKKPTNAPTKAPSKNPTKAPTRTPSKNPSRSPTKKPSRSPTRSPTKSPTTLSPTGAPSPRPTGAPTESTELATTIIPGAAVGGGVLAIVGVIYFRYFRKGGGDGNSGYTPGRRVGPRRGPVF